MTSILLKFIIYLSCERALKNGRVKLKIFRKSSLNFTFGQGSCLISDFARPISNKVVLLQISLSLGDLGQKTHPCFYGIFLMILWKKCLVQSFVVPWPVLTKLWSYKVLNPARVTWYQRMYKAFHSWFSLGIFVEFMKKELFT